MASCCPTLRCLLSNMQEGTDMEAVDCSLDFSFSKGEISPTLLLDYL